MCDEDRDDSHPRTPLRTCLACGILFAGKGRALYHSRACQQRAYRLRQASTMETRSQAWASELRDQQALVAQTIYQCPRCEERYLGERRCPECNLMCRKLGLGGRCQDCDAPILVDELLGRA